MSDRAAGLGAARAADPGWSSLVGAVLRVAGRVLASDLPRLALVAGVAFAELSILNTWAFAHVAFHDGGIVIYGAERMLRGEVPYRDFFLFVTPGSLMLLNWLYALLGVTIVTTFTATSLLAAIMALAASGATRALGLEWRWAALAGWLAVQVGIVWWPTPSYHWFATAVGMLGIWAVVDVVRSDRRVGYTLAGLVMASTCWFLQPRGALLALVVVAALAAARPRALRPLLLGAALAALPLVPLLWIVPVETLWADLVAFPLTAYPAANLAPVLLFDLMPSAPLIDPARKALQVLFEMLFLAAAPVVVVFVLGVSRRARHLGVAVAALAAVAAIVSVGYRPIAGHLAFAAPFVVAPLLWLVAILARKSAMVRAGVVVVSVAAVIVFAPTREALLVMGGRAAMLETPRGRMPVASDEDPAYVRGSLAAVLEEIEARTHRDDAIFAYPALPALFFIADRRDATRYDYLWPGENTPKQFEEVAAVLELDRPALVIRDLSPGDFLDADLPTDTLRSQRLLDSVLARQYELVREIGSFQILAPRTE